MAIKKLYRKLCIAILSAWICLAMASPINANAQNSKRYGECTVSTQTDMNTEAKSHNLSCITVTDTDSSAFQISQSAPKQLTLVLSTSVIDYEDDEIPIVLRIDKGDPIKRTAKWYYNSGSTSTGSAIIEDTQIPQSFMNEFAKGKRLNFQVGNKNGYIKLDGSSAAVSDFKQRVKTLINADFENARTDGICKTDPEYPELLCKESTSTITIYQGDSGELELWLTEDKVSHEEDEIPIALKIDEGKWIKRNARWDSDGFAIIKDNEFALSVMNELENGKRLNFQVGKERGNITLNGSKAAVQDFKQRVKTLINADASSSANASGSADFENVKTDGICKTDPEYRELLCEESTSTDSMRIGIYLAKGKLALWLSKDKMSHEGDEIPIALKIDKGDPIKRNAQWDSDWEYAYIEDNELARLVMDELENGKRVLIQVGKERGEITLNNIKAAMQDFKKIIETSINTDASGNNDVSDTFDIVNKKTYGKCEVRTQIDSFTDAESHHLLCEEASPNDFTKVEIYQLETGKAVLRLSKGKMSHEGDKIPIVLRIDRADPTERDARWDSDRGYATIDDNQLALSVMKKLENAKRVVIKVGNKSGKIELDGAKDGMQDFNQRIKTLINTDTSVTFDIKNKQTYGNCEVRTQIDSFTDVESHHLSCEEVITINDEKDETRVEIYQLAPRKPVLRLSKGKMSHEEDEIRIVLRIDRAEPTVRDARWDSDRGYATIDDNQLALSVMDQLENAKRVAIKVGNKSGKIELDGVKDGMRDFNQRIKTLIKADTSDIVDIENDQTYGNCEVRTQIDSFTDVESHHLLCKEATPTDFTGVRIYQREPGKLALWLSKGAMDREVDEIPIVLTIDGVEVIKEENALWDSDSGYATIDDNKLALSVMDELAKGKRVDIKVDEKGGSIILDGASDAVRDFNQRIKMLINADTSDIVDIENDQTYGNCEVRTQIDSFTDVESHHLLCKEATPTDFTGVRIYQREPGKLALWLSKGAMDREVDEIPIVLTIDGVEVIKEENALWDSDSGYATIDDNKLALSVMDELAKGKRVDIKVDEKGGSIILDGASDAVRDFNQRIKMLINADTSDIVDIENDQTYGNCEVRTQIDSFTDVESHHLLCKEATPTDFTGVRIYQREPGKLALWLSKGAMDREVDEIPIVLTIDGVEVIKEENALWDSDSGYATIDDNKLALSVMDELAKGKRVDIKVDEKGGSIILDGASDAVRDFNQRIKMLINADTSDIVDIENDQTYGNCEVRTQIDSFTDVESHHLLCKEATPTDFTGVRIYQREPGKLALWLSKGAMDREVDEILIEIRIDEGEWIERNALWDSDSGYATIDDNKLALSVMDELEKGKRVDIKVDEKGGSIILDGASDAVRDFKERIK